MTPRTTWRDLPSPVRTLGRWVTLVQVVGYTTSLLFVRQTTGVTPAGVAERYRGADVAAGTGPMHFAKSLAEMLTITHTHLFGLVAIFALSGAGLTLCRAPTERWRRILIAEPFLAILISFAAMWLMRYVDARFSGLLIASSSLMAAAFYAQSWFLARELWFPRTEADP